MRINIVPVLMVSAIVWFVVSMAHTLMFVAFLR